MKLAQKLILYALAVALIPLTATGFTLIRLGEGALRERIGEHQRSAAVAVAANVSRAVEDVARHLAVVMGMVDAANLSATEREGLARLLYRQADDIRMAAFFSADGELLAPPAFLEAAELQGTSLGEHPPARSRDVDELRQQMLRMGAGTARAGSVLLSPVYYTEGQPARVVVSLPCCEGRDGRPRAIAAVEIALRPRIRQVGGVETGPDSSVFVVDRDGRIVVHPTLLAGKEMKRHGAVAAFLGQHGSETAVFDTAAGRRAAAFAPVGGLGWGVIVEQPEEVAFAAATSMRRQTLLWSAVTILIVLVSGFLFAGRLRRALAQMMEGARAFGEGRLGRRIEVRSADEIGELATTMNSMAGQLESSLRELEQWSITLEDRVTERTRELQQAQAQLLTQSKLAAVGQLGAGVAHEVNNPLAGILGLTQLLLRDKQESDREFQSLKDIEEAAKRCKAITMRLLRFSERRLVGRSETRVIELLDEVGAMLADSLAENAIEVNKDYAEDIPVITADPAQIGQVFTNLLTNARTAMSDDGGTLSLRVAAKDAGVEIVVTDVGNGIEPEHLPRIFEPFFTTKKVWTDVGLGLSVAHRIVTDHGGTVTAESSPGEGTTMTVYLPIEPPEAVAEVELPRRKMVLLE